VPRSLPPGSSAQLDGQRFQVTGYTVSFTQVMSTQSFTVGGERVAALILANLDGQFEKVVSKSEIVALTFDGTCVVEASAA
jgi:hypothetical protein